MAGTPIINKPIEATNTLIHTVEYGFLIQLVKVSLQYYLPFLKAPLISNIFNAVLNYVADKMYPHITRFVDFQIIDHQVNSQETAYNDSKTKLVTAINTGDQNAINQAKKDLNDSFAKLIHFDGS